MPAKSPIQAEPVTAETAPAAKAAASILPSRPMSKMPARSEKRPARQASSSGVARRRLEPASCRTVSRSISRPSAQRRKARSTGMRTRFSSAPVKRMTSAWITTIMSRLIFGISKASSEPPW